MKTSQKDIPRNKLKEIKKNHKSYKKNNLNKNKNNSEMILLEKRKGDLKM